MFKKNKANKQKGGDGYVINVNEAIGGLPAFSRYSNNYRPIFDGELLQNGGNGYSVDPAIDIGGMPGIIDYKESKFEHGLEDTLVSGGSKKTKKDKKNKNNKQSGGDGYSVDPSMSIDGMPVYSRYTSNDTPIFEGSLLDGGSKKTKKNKQHKQTGGDGYSIDPSASIDGIPVVNGYTYDDTPIFEGSLLDGGSKKTKKISIYKFLKMQAGGGGCGCDGSKTEDPSIFNLIKMSGGMKDNKKTQFHAIKEIATLLVPLSTKSLLSLNSKIFLNSISEKKPVKYKQLGGYVDQIESILAPLGKNNLLVLAALLLLHHFAVESQKKTTSKELKGGNPFISSLSEILAPLGVNTLGSSLLLILLQQSFVGTKSVSRESSKNSKNKKILLGGNPLKNLIAPLGNNAFIAVGLLILLERLFVNKINESKTKDKEKKILIGGRANKKYEELFNLIAPITFNIFAKESFLMNYANKNLKKLKNNSKK
jgi:hypothetical protein